jgi:hypothetical protein
VRKVRRFAVGIVFLAGVVAASVAPAAAIPIDLHGVNWRAARLPGEVCGLHHAVRLHGGKVHVSSRLEIDAGWHRVVYGDLDGDGRDEAALSVACSNGGGTADSVLSYAVVVFHATIRSSVPIGILRPRHRPPHQLPTLLQVQVDPGRVVGREAFYGSNDGTCCPSGRARTVWTYRHGTFRLASSRITKRPG